MALFEPLILPKICRAFSSLPISARCLGVSGTKNNKKANKAAGTAFDDVSRNGLNSKYMDAATIPAPEVIITTDQVKQMLRPAMFSPAPAEAPPVLKTAAKPATRKKAAPKATAVANKVVENTMKANQAPAVEEAA